jgi:HAD superfamily 5'-nucleotidase-like hydrolase
MSTPARRTTDPLEALEHLLEVPRPQPLPAPRQIAVNRDLRMDHIDMVGFDMDYTLAIYSKPHIERLAFDLTARRLVDAKGYPEEVLSLAYDPAFCLRGLVVDKKLGTVLKMDRHKHVGRGYQGRRLLTKEERRTLYRGVRIRLGLPRYHLIDTLFALPEVALFSEIVDRANENPEIYPPYETLFGDIRECIDAVHRDDSLKSVVRADLGRFLAEDPELPLALHKLRSSGKKLFILTNSLWDYTDQVMTFLFSGRLAQYPSWRNYFDVVVVGAEKPNFFAGNKPFFVLDPHGKPGDEAQGRFDRLHVYSGGNLTAFERLAGCGGDRILYVGDHIYGDILRSKKHSGWRTALIIEELEDEITHLLACGEDFRRIRELEARCKELDMELNYLQSVQKALQRTQERNEISGEDELRLEAARRQNRVEIDHQRNELHVALADLQKLEQRCEQVANPYWGLLFREGLETSRFGDQVRDYACVYTSRVSNFLYYSPMQYFRSSRDLMPHERL